LSGLDDLKRYNPEDLEPYLLDVEAREEYRVSFEGNGHDPEGARVLLSLVREKIPEWVLLAIEEGPKEYDPPPRWDGLPRDSSASGADSVVCYYLARAGLTDDQIHDIYKTFPIGAQGKYSRKGQGDKYLKRTIGEMRGNLAKEKTAKLKDKEKIGAYEANPSRLEETGVLVSDVIAEEIKWLWESRLARGKLALVDGDPALGKSAAILDLAARLSAGKSWPDGSRCEPGGVVLLNAEDGLADTIRPRLDVAGADVSRILALATVADGNGQPRLLSIPEDIPIIEAGIRRVGAALVIVDPLMAFLSGEHNSHRDQDVRRALAPLAALAERRGVAVLVIRHLNKTGSSNPLYRGGGSIGIIGAARMGFLVAKDPQNEERRILASTKTNLAQPPKSLSFTLEGAENGAVKVVWCGESELSAKDLLATSQDQEEAGARSEAVEFLRAVLSESPHPASQVKAEAEDAGISERTLARAKKLLGVEAYREGEEGKRGAGTWFWQLPAIKAAKLRGWAALNENENQDPENPAYLSQKHAAIKAATIKDAKPPDGSLNRNERGQETEPEITQAPGGTSPLTDEWEEV
jgi:hypothetical protein